MANYLHNRTISYAADDDNIISEYENDIDTKVDLSQCIFPLTTCKHFSKFKETYKFPDVANMDDLPKFTKEECYWHHLWQKKKAFKYSKEYISAYIERKIEKISDYFYRLEANKLTEKEINKKKPQNFLGPYFPSPKEIQMLKSLHIEIDWSIPKIQQCYFNRKINCFLSTSTKDKEYLVKRWQQFQNKYKFYDLRPITGVRCGSYDKNTGFIFFRMIDHETRLKFLQFMGKGLPHKSLYFIEYNLAKLCDKFSEGKFDIEKKRIENSGKEFRCIVELYDRYGIKSPPMMELIIGKRNKSRYYSYISGFLGIMHIPIKCGAWQKEEDLKIIKNVYENKESFEIFNDIKTRTFSMIIDRKNHLKKALASIETSLSVDEQKRKQWTDKDYIKLITAVYESKAKAMSEIKWDKIAENFPGFCDYSLRTKFYFLYKTRIPKEKQKYFDEALEFLYHNVTPIYNIKHVRHKRLKTNLSYALDLCKSSKEAKALSQYFNTVDLRDEEEECQIIKKFRTSYSEGSISKRDIITLDDDDIVLLDDNEGGASGRVRKKRKVTEN